MTADVADLEISGMEPLRGERETNGVASFEDVFAAEFRPLFRYLQRRVGAAAAEDLAEAAFATAFARWERLDPARPARPWLYGIAANLLRHHWRDEQRMLRAYARNGVDPVLADDDEAVARVDAGAQGRALAAALAELRAGDREILLLHAWAELSDSEIADALSLPLGTVKSRLHRTRERLRNRLDPDGQVAVKASSTAAKEPQ
jgi:RNA polymerase sigma factor (sigma-70 family)